MTTIISFSILAWQNISHEITAVKNLSQIPTIDIPILRKQKGIIYFKSVLNHEII